MDTAGPSIRTGRPPATSRASISHAGLELFTRRGFEETSVEEVAEAAGISRRTLFRYFPSKNDVPWGDFDAELLRMRRFLDQLPASTPLAVGLRLALLDFNTFPSQEAGFHRQRMTLLLRVPALQAHSTLKYAGWRRVVAEHVAAHLGERPDDHHPRTVAWLLLGVALAAYEQWLDEPAADLHELLAAGSQLVLVGRSAAVAAHLADRAGVPLSVGGEPDASGTGCPGTPPVTVVTAPSVGAIPVIDAERTLP